MRLSHLRFALALGALAVSAASAGYGFAPYNLTLGTLATDSSNVAAQADLTTAGLSVFDATGLNDNGTPGDPADDYSPAVSFDANGFHFGALATGDNGRNYIRTTEANFAVISFVADITFEIANNDQQVFFGLGAGDRALFGTPDWSTQFSSASFWPEAANDKIVAFRTQNDINSFVDKPVPGLDAGVHRLRMTFNNITRQLVGSIDLNYAGGPFVADATTLPIVTNSLYAADGWLGEPSRIFFGGDDGATFRDFRVQLVPEPGACVMGAALAAAALAARRRTTIG